MNQKGYQKSVIGDGDGIFWITFDDFVVHFEEVNICRFFSKEWTKISFKGEWSEEKGTNGGCPNYDSFIKNP